MLLHCLLVSWLVLLLFYSHNQLYCRFKIRLAAIVLGFVSQHRILIAKSSGDRRPARSCRPLAQRCRADFCLADGIDTRLSRDHESVADADVARIRCLFPDSRNWARNGVGPMVDALVHGLQSVNLYGIGHSTCLVSSNIQRGDVDACSLALLDRVAAYYHDHTNDCH